MSAAGGTTGVAREQICPRCGYDQAGIVATWGDAWPLRGRCSECGLEFWWRQVLGEPVLGPGWSVEHGRRLTLGRLARAWARGVWQGAMWQEMELRGFSRPGRLVAFALIVLLVTHLALAVLVQVSRWVTFRTQTGDWSFELDVWAWLVPWLRSVEVSVGWWSTTHFPVFQLAVPLLVGTLVPVLCMCVFTETMSRVGVRWTHFLRGAVYALAGGLAAVIIGAVLGSAMLYAEARSGTLAKLGFGDLGRGALLLAVGVAWPTLQVLQWRSVVCDYLRLPRGGWIVASVAVITGLCMLILACFGIWLTVSVWV